MEQGQTSPSSSLQPSTRIPSDSSTLAYSMDTLLKVEIPMIQAQESRQSLRPPRLHVASFDGTAAGGILCSRNTVVPELVKLISKHENVSRISAKGVGSDTGILDRIFGGLSGWGILKHVITAYRTLSNDYEPGDRIILTGYSRGAWAARYLAKIIEAVGLPKDGDPKFFRALYKACDQEYLFNNPETCRALVDGYECWTDVNIDALCCFDTVGSLGIPVTGLAKPLSVFCRRRKHKRSDELVYDVAFNVRFSFHCLALHESRSPYTPTLMRGHSAHQVYFPGNHSNLGWIDDTACQLVHAPLAWMVQQLHTHLNISFDQDKLAARFPAYSSPAAEGHGTRESASIEPGSRKEWYKGDVKRTNPILLAIVGKRPAMGPVPMVPRTSSSTRVITCNAVNAAADVKVHIGARLRENEMDDFDGVPGYRFTKPVRGSHYWVRKGSWGKGKEAANRMPGRLEEAQVGFLEARLLGLPEEVVGRRGCDALCCSGATLKSRC
ncbi:hypothetical protein QBC38DRAFT_151232 [Podospora fimiseda]|uniref:T6SS Phospholipase effector Tle1-like catalytic domain-containing protein n=1 Tax=Podospora fimiseda TaxID=252190 RepID=A0AAN7BSG9_9PEZI|nr:hypothetical protein QBC38DRAFT_151232 [Podospora fimiseda]